MKGMDKKMPMKPMMKEKDMGGKDMEKKGKKMMRAKISLPKIKYRDRIFLALSSYYATRNCNH